MDENFREKLKNIKAVVFDGDGVLFTGRVFMDKQGEAMKERSHIDGQGISLLRAAGIKIAFVSAEKSGFLEAVGQKLNMLPSVASGKWDKVGVFTDFMGKGKVDVVQGWLNSHAITLNECVAMGDDMGDYSLLKVVGFAAVPAQAEEIIKSVAHFVAPREGGNGAVRDLCNLILAAKNIDLLSLDLK